MRAHTWHPRKRKRSRFQTTPTSPRAARLGVARTRATRSSAPSAWSPISCAPRRRCPGYPGTLSALSGARGGRATTTTAPAAVSMLAASIHRTHPRHSDRRCPHRRQTCRQACHPACRHDAKNGARLLLPAGTSSAKCSLEGQRPRAPSAPNAALQARALLSHHQRRYHGHGRPNLHLRRCLGRRCRHHPHRSRQSRRRAHRQL